MPMPSWLKHLSFSALQAYENCPRCFFLKYSLGIWEIEKGPALLFGSELHDQIAKYHGHIKPDWKRRWDGECPIEIKNEIRPYIDMYKKMYTPEAEHVEQEFLLDFLHPDTKKSLGIPLKGFIDLIKDDYVIDHKTSSGRFAKRDIHDLKQLSLYSYAYRQLSKKKEQGLKVNAFLKRKGAKHRSLEVMETLRDQADYMDFWVWAKFLIDKIKENNFERNNAPVSWWFRHLEVCT